MLQAIDATADALKTSLDEFARFLEVENRAPDTIRTYRWGIEDWCDYLRSRGVFSLRQVGRPDVEAWQHRLLAAQMGPRSRSLATTAVALSGGAGRQPTS